MTRRASTRPTASPAHLLAAFAGATVALPLSAQDVSPAPILQWFEAKYDTQIERTADLFMAGYGGTWVPPTGRADSGNQSVGYDVFDRFDLGSPGNETLYGTEGGLRQFVSTMHRAGSDVYVDLIWNHNGFRDHTTPGFIAEGGYPGFVHDINDGPNDDYHARTATGELDFRLAGLIDIDQAQNIQVIRHPVDPNDPQNITPGTLRNLPDPDNARYYPDRDLGGTTVFDPARNTNVTVYDFNAENPLAGDAVPENATGLLMRNVRWMIQDIGVDGFRVDAGRHFPRWVLPFLDEAMFNASRRTNLDGSRRHAYAFTEVGFDSAAFQQDFIRLDVNAAPGGQLGGNRDALDFNFFGAVNGNLQDVAIGNDWNNVVNASIDLNDDGFMNGSQGVKFVESHDDFGPGMINVAYAYMLMLPGNANVYYNAQQNFDPLRAFPKDGSGDSLGNYGDTRTTLVDIRSRYGRGNFLPRFLEKENYAYEREKAALVLLSNRNDAGFDPRTIQTAFDPGTWLVELTGNAANEADIPEFLEVQANGSVNARFLRSDGEDKGYLIYGVKTPESANGIELLGPGVGGVLAGDTPPNITGDETEQELGNKLRENGGARLTDLHVIDGDTFTVRLATQAVTLDVPGIAGGVRDADADGDFAALRINEGLDLNGNGVVDVVTPGDVAYGFEGFVTTNNPGFGSATGDGLYEQTIDASQLPEGMNFLTVRAFRHRNPGTGGDGGPAVFTEFKKVLWVDRLPAELVLDSQDVFNPVAGGIAFNFVNEDRTAEEVYIIRNLGAAVDDQTILNGIGPGTRATDFGDGLFGDSFNGVDNGNHTFTIVSIERTGRTSIQRLVGVEVTGGQGVGQGDINGDGLIDANDIFGAGTDLEDVIFSNNTEFDPGADPNADGLVDVRDLLALGAVYEGPGAEAGAATAYVQLLEDRGDLDDSETFDAGDIDELYSRIETTNGVWFYDLDVDGNIDLDDVAVLVQDFFRTNFGDANLNGQVEQGDLDAVLQNWGGTTGTNPALGWATGDLNGNGQVEQGDLDDVLQNWGATAAPSFALNPEVAAFVPEPGSLALLAMGSALLTRRRR